MNEIELLKELNKLEKEMREAEWFIKYRKDEIDKPAVKEKLLNDVKHIEESLVRIPDKSYSNAAINNLKRQLNAYITEVGKAQPELRLSRNQGLILENHLFSIILRDVYYFVEGEPSMIHIPAYLYYTRSEEDSVSTSELIDFFKLEIALLNKIQEINYVKLRGYVEDFKNRIIERFIRS